MPGQILQYNVKAAVIKSRCFPSGLIRRSFLLRLMELGDSAIHIEDGQVQEQYLLDTAGIMKLRDFFNSQRAGEVDDDYGEEGFYIF